MVWYPFLGWSVFIVGLIVAIIMFSNMKRLYPVMYVASIALYIFTAGFFMDVYDLSKGGILLVLVISAIIFMLLGWYFSRIFGHDKGR
jgi:hypothetical protein